MGLDRLGLKENDVVMIHSSNHIFVPCAYLGIAGSGRIFSGCNPAYGVAGESLLCPVHMCATADYSEKRRLFNLRTPVQKSFLSNHLY